MGKTLINDFESLAASEGFGIFNDILADFAERVSADNENKENIIGEINGLNTETTEEG